MIQTGLVVSDLHLFAQRSEGESRFRDLAPTLDGVDTLVLNGDTFDFRWALCPHSESIPLALNWLSELTVQFPQLEIHFLAGNHDCLPRFVDELCHLPSVRFHPHYLILGSNLFLHGDPANRKMDLDDFRQYRSVWERDSPRNKTQARLYGLTDTLGLSKVFHHLYFSGGLAESRIEWHLDQCLPGWSDDIRDCYFGHTHVPFRDRNRGRIRFHNTGAAIRGMRFQPLSFTYDAI